MAETTFPGTGNTFRDEWPSLMGPDGIVEDYDGSAFGMTTSGSSPEVTITPGSASQPIGRYRVAGFLCALDAPKSLNLSTVPGATNPTSGQKRVDRIVARYDWSKSANTAASIEIRPGTPVSTSVADTLALPALAREWGDVWESPLRWVSRPSGGVVTANGVEKLWSAEDELLTASMSVDYAPAPIGRRRLKGAETWNRVLLPGGADWIESTGGQRQWFGRRSGDDAVAGAGLGTVASIDVTTVPGGSYHLSGTLVYRTSVRNGVRVQLNRDSSSLNSVQFVSNDFAGNDRAMVSVTGVYEEVAGGSRSFSLQAGLDGGSATLALLAGSHLSVVRTR